MIAISISDVHPDPLGPDRIRNQNIKLNQEWIEIENVGDEPLELKGKVLIIVSSLLPFFDRVILLNKTLQQGKTLNTEFATPKTNTRRRNRTP
ncbi:hypothetical protein E3J74_08505 [Candidatus Bathyarchaeota archaeon]|nr:MAG: hypothetical protein E3J74_08505 [Candidatus Bathyarchaeota archaeon]